MGQVPRVSLSGGTEPDLVALSQQVNEILRVIDNRIEFGEPQDPAGPTTLRPDGSAASLAGAGFATPTAGAHNGTTSNILGSWVEVVLPAVGTNVVRCYHNLFLDDNVTPQYTVPVSGEPNVRWLLFGCGHSDGDAAGDATSGLLVTPAFILGNAVTAKYIDLSISVATVGTALTISADYPVLACLFFTQASRGVAG